MKTAKATYHMILLECAHCTKLIKNPKAKPYDNCSLEFKTFAMPAEVKCQECGTVQRTPKKSKSQTLFTEN